jgi:Protein of unknown function DUF262/Protein of unknown function (DUF1524)
MDIKPVDRTIRNLLESGFYKIPRFQRPYSWEATHVEDFWDDAITSADLDYFIGSFVVYPESKSSDTLMVVDGQQRLTTITLLLAALRNAFDAEGNPALAKGIQKRIETEDLDNTRQYILQSETSYPYLQEHIQKHGSADLPPNPGSEEVALKEAFELLAEKVGSVLDAIESDASIAKAKKASAKQKRLQQLRDKVLRLQLIVVQLSNEDDAYLIFETLNTRGKNLGVSDLVKNHVTRLMKPTNKGVDVARDRWNTVRTTLDESASDLDLNRFIYHSWLSRHPYVGNAALFREIKTCVRSASEAKQFLETLSLDVGHYRTVLEPESHQWPHEHRDIASSLRTLNAFRVVQPVPLTLAILRSLAARELTTKQVRQTLLALENFHAQFTGVAAQRTGGGTARMYAAEDLCLAGDTNKRSKVLREFVEKLRQRVPAFEEFEANLQEISYRSDNTRDKPVVQLLLRRVHEHFAGTASATDYSAMSIEHVYPERPAGTPAVEAELVGAIGNLILLPKGLNEKLANRQFSDKVKAYKEHGIPLDPALARATKWTKKEIKERTKSLAKLLHEKLLRV